MKPLRLEYSFRKREAWIYMAKGQHIDLASAVSMVAMLDGDVEFIFAMSGGDTDACYCSIRGHWVEFRCQNGDFIDPYGPRESTDIDEMKYPTLATILAGSAI